MTRSPRPSHPGRLCLVALAALCCLGSYGLADTTLLQTDFGDGRIPPWLLLPIGSWQVTGGILANRQPGGGQIRFGDKRWGDYEGEVRLRTARQGSKAWSVGRFLVRYTGPGDYYYVVLHADGRLELGCERSGRHCPGLALAADVGKPGDWHTFRVNAAGARIRVAVDGRDVLDFADPEPGSLQQGHLAVDAFQGSLIEVASVTVRSDTVAAQTTAMLHRRAQRLNELGYAPAAKGNVAIFRDSRAPVDASCPSDPDVLAEWLRRAGYAVTFLAAEDLAAEFLLTPKVFRALVLPYGSAFPREAIGAFREFLAQGGHFLTTGGYFGDQLYAAADRAVETANWVDNGTFTAGLEGWRPSVVRPGFHCGSDPQGACIEVDAGTEIDWYSLEQEVRELRPGVPYHLAVRARSIGQHDGHGVYAAVNYFGADGKRLGWKQSPMLQGTTDWQVLEVRDNPPPATATATLNLILHGYGKAGFAAVHLSPALGEPAVLNTRSGDIKGPGNSLRVAPAQIGLFAPNYPLENVASVVASTDQVIIPPDTTFAYGVSGFSASGLFTGNGDPVAAVQEARPIYLLDCLDAFGRLRGRAGALVRHYRGPYAGSNWAAFGVTDRDLFAGGSAAGETVLVRTMEALLTECALTEAGAELACYRPGETPTFFVDIANFSAAEVTVSLTVSVSPDNEPGLTCFTKTLELTCPAGRAPTRASCSWPGAILDRDLYTVRVDCRLGDGTLDRLQTAFVVWQKDRLAAGPRLTVGGSYLQRNGRATFQCGSSDSGYPYFSQSETPLVWDRQFRLMRDSGLRYYRCMHFFHRLSPEQILEFPGYDATDSVLRERIRRLDALVYLAQKHGLCFMFVDNCGILQARYRPGELAARQRLLADVARRYAAVPGFFFNLDHQEFIRGPSAESDALFRAFLRDRYPTAEAFAEAWGQWTPAAGFEGVEFTEAALLRTGPATTPSRDVADFLDTSREAWRGNHAGAVHGGNPGALVSQDFSLYWRPDFRWPEPAVMSGLDLVSAHFYGAEADFPVRAKRINMQAIGKPAGMTEFGILTHPAWRGQPDARIDPDAADAFFAMATHYAFGLGMSLMSNWNWKEMRECIFPWSVANHDLVPKPHLNVYRNLACLFGSSLVTPCYVPPSVFVVCPSSAYLTADYAQVEKALTGCIRDLLPKGVGFGLIGEQYLDALPDTVQVLVLPLQKDAPERSSWPPALRPSPALRTCAWRAPGDADEALAGMPVLPVHAKPLPIQAFTVRMSNPAGIAFVLFNATDQRNQVTVRFGGRELQLVLAPGRPGFARFSDDGALLAVECQEQARIGGRTLFTGTGHVILLALDPAGVEDPAAALVALFVGTADVALPVSADAAGSRRAEFGEFRDQTWHVLQSADAAPGLPLRLIPSGALRSGMALIAPPAKLAEYRIRAAQSLFP